jgi:hypothetical protein
MAWPSLVPLMSPWSQPSRTGEDKAIPEGSGWVHLGEMPRGVCRRGSLRDGGEEGLVW